MEPLSPLIVSLGPLGFAEGSSTASLSKAASLRPPYPQHHCSSYLRNSNSTQMILIHQLNFKRELGKHSCCQKYLALFGLFHPNSSLCLD